MEESKHLCVADVFLENEDNEILMIKRDENKKVLPGFYNGIGGKLEQGETPIQAVLREADEEAGAKTITNLKIRGNLTVKDKFGIWQVYIFQGNIRKNDISINSIPEGKLEWIPKNDLKKYNLVEDLKHWLPIMLADPKIFQFVNIEYDNNYKLLNIDIKQLSK